MRACLRYSTRAVLLILCLAAVRAVQAADPSAEEAPLGLGDVVRITVYDNPDLTTEAEISDGGKISFPLIGGIELGGLTPADAAALIARRLGEGEFVPDAHVNLRVIESHSRLVSVLGEVGNPGNYPVPRPTRVTDVLASAGGINERGSQTVAIIRHGPDGATRRHEVDLSGTLNPAEQGADLLVRAGDVVFVPPAPLIYVYGEVRKPGAYPLKPGMTLVQALSVGGGLTARGTERGIRVERAGPDGAKQKVRLSDTDPLAPGDVVRVPESWF